VFQEGVNSSDYLKNQASQTSRFNPKSAILSYFSIDVQPDLRLFMPMNSNIYTFPSVDAMTIVFSGDDGQSLSSDPL
jgi:hypothetical protein